MSKFSRFYKINIARDDEKYLPNDILTKIHATHAITTYEEYYQVITQEAVPLLEQMKQKLKDLRAFDSLHEFEINRREEIYSDVIEQIEKFCDEANLFLKTELNRAQLYDQQEISCKPTILKSCIDGMDLQQPSMEVEKCCRICHSKDDIQLNHVLECVIWVEAATMSIRQVHLCDILRLAALANSSVNAQWLCRAHQNGKVKFFSKEATNEYHCDNAQKDFIIQTWKQFNILVEKDSIESVEQIVMDNIKYRLCHDFPTIFMMHDFQAINYV